MSNAKILGGGQSYVIGMVKSISCKLNVSRRGESTPLEINSVSIR